MVPHTYATNGGFPGAIQQMPAARMHPLCISHRARSLWAEQSAHIGRQGPLCATVMCEDPDAHLPSEYDGFEAISLCTPQSSIGDQLMPA